MLLGFPLASAATAYGPSRYVYGLSSPSMSYTYSLNSTRSAGSYVAGDYTTTQIPAGGYFINAVVTSSGTIHVYVEYANATADTGVSVVGTGSSQTVSYSLNAARNIEAIWVTSNASFSVSNVSATVAPLPPTTPTGLSVSSIGSNSAKLSWSADSGATSYNIYDATSLNPIVTGISSTSYNLSGLVPLTGYRVAVSAVNASGESPESGYVSFTTLGPPVTPSGVSVGTVTSGSFTVSWGSVTGVQSYDVYVDGVKSATGVTGTSKVMGGYKSGSSHTVAVSSVNAYGESGVSVSVPVTLGSLPAPSGLVASVGNKQVSLTWQPVSGATSYQIYMNGVAYQTASGTSFSVTGLTNGTTYQFSVSALDAWGNSGAQSSIVSARPQPPPVPVNGLAFVQYGTGVKAVWGGTMSPFSITVKDGSGKVIDTLTTSSDSVVVTGLKLNTVYTFSITDAGMNTLTSSFNSGSTISLIPPSLPDATPTYNSMGDIFRRAGIIGLYVIGGAVALGAIVIVLVYGWRQLKWWLNSAGTGSYIVIDGEDVDPDLDGYGWYDDDFKFHVYKEYEHYFK